MIIISIAYCVFAFLIIRFFVTLYNFVSKPYLPHFQEDISLADVSILIPARNEAINIGNLLMQFKHINIKEIIVLDDNSTDNTKFIAIQYAFLNKKIKVLDGQNLPAHWLGKNWACHQLANQAAGKYFLFLDADVEISEKGIKNAVLQMQKSGADMLSLFPDQTMQTFGEKLVVPLMHYLLLTLLPLKLVRNSKFPSLSAANGQFMLFKSDVYKANNFHEKVKNSILDDVSIFRLAKTIGLACETLLSDVQIKCRMYKSYGDGINGFSKNLFLGFGKNILGFSLYLFLIYFGFIFILLTQNIILIISSLCLVLGIRIMISKLANQSVFENMYLHFLQITTYIYIGFKSVYVHSFGKINWKNREI